MMVRISVWILALSLSQCDSIQLTKPYGPSFITSKTGATVDSCGITGMFKCVTLIKTNNSFWNKVSIQYALAGILVLFLYCQPCTWEYF
jgi:hypothetical protein